MRRLVYMLAVLFTLATVVRIACAQTYPQRILWAMSKGWGDPIMHTDGTLDTALVRQMAMYNDAVGLNVVPWADARPDIIPALKAWNPKLKVLASSTLGVCWPYGGNNFWARIWTAASNTTNGILIGQDGKEFPDSAAPWVNWGSKTMMQSLTMLWLYGPCEAPGIDGIICDYAGASISWAHNAGGFAIDPHRAGFATLAQMDSARTVNLASFLNTIRTAHPQFIIIGNGVEHDAQTKGLWDGDVLEGWPRFRGGFAGSMAAYWADPPLTMVKLEGGSGPGGQYSAESCRLERFTAGCAALGDGFQNFYPDEAAQATLPWHGKWMFDYESVYSWPARRTDLSGNHKGWLGVKANPAVFMRDSLNFPAHSDSLQGLWRRDFPNGMVLVNGSSYGHWAELMSPLWFRIYGVRDPATNCGGDARTRYYVPANDALFLMRKPYVKPPASSGRRNRLRTVVKAVTGR
jgi:hypothetical protein